MLPTDHNPLSITTEQVAITAWCIDGLVVYTSVHEFMYCGKMIRLW